MERADVARECRQAQVGGGYARRDLGGVGQRERGGKIPTGQNGGAPKKRKATCYVQNPGKSQRK